MFDWFWEFLYSLSKALMRVCDWLMDVSRVLIGIDPISVNGEQTDFITYLLQGEKVTFAFKTAFSIGIIMLFLFAVIAIVLNLAKEDKSQTPGQIVAKAFKALIGFLLVPSAMIILVAFINEVMKGLYQATNGSAKNLSCYLFTVFADNAGLTATDAGLFLTGVYDYTDTTLVSMHIVLKEFDFFFSWVVCGFIMYNLVSSLLLFVERAISIVILFIASPFSIGATVLDDGGHFKTWREQVISKFLTAYGAVISINIFMMLVDLVIKDSIVFFGDPILNRVCKIMIILGGALSMRKGTILIAQLLSPSSFHDVADSLAAGQRFAGGVMAAGKTAAGLGLKAAVMPFKAARAINNFAVDAANGGIGKALADRLGWKTGGGGGGMPGGAGGGTPTTVPDAPETNQNTNSPQYNDSEKQNLLNQALGNKQNANQNNNGQTNNQKPNAQLNNSIQNSLKNNSNNNNGGKR